MPSHLDSHAQDVIRIAIVDDHQMLIEALTLVINKEPDLTMVGSVNTCGAAVSLVQTYAPDVLLLDVSLPDGDGLSQVPRLRAACPSMQILVLTSLADETTLLRAVEVGVGGFVGKHRPVSEVFSAIRQAHEGEIVMPSNLLIGLLSRRNGQPAARPATAQPEFEPLTTREREILVHTAQGKNGTLIAEELNISPMTVRTHLRNLMSKLNVHSRLEAVAFAMRHGLIEPPS